MNTSHAAASFSFFVDINECDSSTTNSCDQVCRNTEGSYACDCSSGFQLNNDGNSCSGEPERYLFTYIWSDSV